MKWGSLWHLSSLSCCDLTVIIRRLWYKNIITVLWFAGWYLNNSLFLVFENNVYDFIMASWRLNWPWQSYHVYDFLMWTRKAYVTFELYVKRSYLQIFSWVVCQLKTSGFYSCHIFTCCLYRFILSDCFPVSV